MKLDTQLTITEACLNRSSGDRFVVRFDGGPYTVYHQIPGGTERAVGVAGSFVEAESVVMEEIDRLLDDGFARLVILVPRGMGRVVVGTMRVSPNALREIITHGTETFEIGIEWGEETSVLGAVNRLPSNAVELDSQFGARLFFVAAGRETE